MRGTNRNTAANDGLIVPALRRLKEMFAHADMAQTEPNPHTWQVDTDAAGCKVCVLVVDDNPVSLMIVSEMLSYLGIKPLVAEDGAQAVALAGELQLDLILMDLQMPVLDGFAATVQIRRVEKARSRARVPVVAYSSMDPTAALLDACGIDGVLTKPCDVQALRECLIRWCPETDGILPS
jgi:CheY-like chemotaxis protein